MNMPVPWLRAMADSMEFLEAQEAFRQSEIIAMGTGSLSKTERGKVAQRWRMAMGDREENVLRGNKAGLAMLRAKGIEVREDGPR